jgi:hypothetical protein
MNGLKTLTWLLATVALIGLAGCGILQPGPRTRHIGPRQVICLDGTGQIAEGDMETVPKTFEHKAPVPGLVDMAEPAFAEVGKKSDKRGAFWYRRTFAVDGPIPEIAILKVHKAKYGTKVVLNGAVVGEHLPCFTPGYFDLKPHLKGDRQQNELLVRVGADRESLPQGMPTGWDFEKYLYIPGIYDSVELILTGKPYIVNVQTAPDITAGAVRVVSEIQGSAATANQTVTYQVLESRTGRLVSSLQQDVRLAADRITKLDVTIPIKDCKLWSPENPFLYKLKIDTGGDCVQVRFGMRSFRFDRQSGRAIMNGKPYFMRGTNVCVYRFFEDGQRGDRPWREEWVERLHRRFKGMHWNSMRYCIGFPPEFWYEIADEVGFLIQDEFPIWLLDRAPENPLAEKIVPQYTEWMRERWNHPCVVIWDAQNESVTPETGKALSAVRHLDLSNRPWENGWAEPVSDDDCVEAHPYLFYRTWAGQKSVKLGDIAGLSGVPELRDAQKKRSVPVIINEYGWLWLNRDGTPTTLTDKVYESLLGPDSTTDQRRHLYAKYLAAKTEFWRCHRECAGVLHFCGLGYSKPGLHERPLGGATSDHFIDIEKLRFEPYFERYVRDAFSPVGLMLDFWDEQISTSGPRQVKVYVINDLYEPYDKPVTVRILNDDKVVAEQSRHCRVEPLAREILTFDLAFPQQAGRYQLVAELVGSDGKPVQSLRDFKVAAALQN